jgi:CRP-like cAMP-binding protein
MIATPCGTALRNAFGSGRGAFPIPATESIVAPGNTGKDMREFSFGAGAGLEQVLPPEHLRRLSDAGTRGTRARGDRLFRQGDPADSVLVLLSGKVKMSFTNSNGQDTLIRIHLPGSLLGLSALGSRGERELTATALEDITFSSIPKQSFMDFVAGDGELGLFLARLLIDRLRSLHSRLGDAPGSTVEQRLAHALIVLSHDQPSPRSARPELTVALTHEELASVVNARRQTVTEALGHFVKSGYIRVQKRRIVITDLDALAGLLPEPPEGMLAGADIHLSAG